MRSEMMMRKMLIPIIQKEASIMDAVRANENADANQDDNRNYPDMLTTCIPVFQVSSVGGLLGLFMGFTFVTVRM